MDDLLLDTINFFGADAPDGYYVWRGGELFLYKELIGSLGVNASLTNDNHHFVREGIREKCGDSWTLLWHEWKRYGEDS